LKAIEDAKITNSTIGLRPLKETPLLKKLEGTMSVAADKALKKLYFIEMRAENMTIEEVNALSKFLKDNNYTYAATKTGLM